MTKRVSISPGIDGIPTSTIPDDPTQFTSWFKNIYLKRWAANADIRNAIPGTGVQISGKLDTPGFVGFEDVSGLSVLGNPTGTAGEVQNISAGADGEFLQREAGALIWGPIIAVTADSVIGSGSALSPIQLVNDSLSPGNSQYYGTDSSGNKGYHPISVTAPALPGTIPDLTLWWESDNILSSTNGADISKLQDRTPWITGLAGSIQTSNAANGFVNLASLNGFNTVQFLGSGTSVGYSIPGTPILNKGVTMFTIFNPSSSATVQAIVGCISSGAIALYQNGVAASSHLSIVNTSSAVLASATTAWTAGAFVQANVTYSPATGNYAFRQARAVAGSGTVATGINTSATGFIGSDSSASAARLTGSSLAVVIIYNRVLSAGEITSIENYLFAKWGV